MTYFFGNIDVFHYVVLGAILFVIGMCGMAVRNRTAISLLISIELMLLAVNINFVAFSSYWHNYDGQIFSVFILTVAAAEAAIGLAILVCYFRNKGGIEVDEIHNLKG